MYVYKPLDLYYYDTLNSNEATTFITQHAEVTTSDECSYLPPVGSAPNLYCYH